MHAPMPAPNPALLRLLRRVTNENKNYLLGYTPDTAKAAADSYCRVKGYGSAGAMEQLTVPPQFVGGAGAWRTYNLVTKEVCNGAGCAAIGVVECVKDGAQPLAKDGNSNVGCGNTGALGGAGAAAWGGAAAAPRKACAAPASCGIWWGGFGGRSTGVAAGAAAGQGTMYMFTIFTGPARSRNCV